MSALERFELKTIEIQEPDKMSFHPAWCFGDVFVVRCSLEGDERWKIGCLSKQKMFPVNRLGLFERLEDACEAAIVVDAHRDWSNVTHFDDDDDAMFKQLREKYNTFTEVMPQEIQAILNAIIEAGGQNITVKRLDD